MLILVYDFLLAVFGDSVVNGLSQEFLAVLCACIFLVVSWVGIKLFQAVGSCL